MKGSIGIQEKLKNIIYKINKDKEWVDIQDDSSLKSDLSFDSITFIFLISNIETCFKIEFSPEEFDIENCETFNDLCEIIKKLLET